MRNVYAIYFFVSVLLLEVFQYRHDSSFMPAVCSLYSSSKTKMAMRVLSRCNNLRSRAKVVQSLSLDHSLRHRNSTSNRVTYL